MKFNIYQIIGGIAYIILTVIIISTMAISPNIGNTVKVLTALVLGPGILYAGAMLLNGVLGSLFKVKDKEYKKKDDKHMMRNDFTSMFESTPKKKLVLIKDVKGRGKKGEIIDVAIGIGNHLLATKNAVEATPENIKSIEIEKDKE